MEVQPGSIGELARVQGQDVPVAAKDETGNVIQHLEKLSQKAKSTTYAVMNFKVWNIATVGSKHPPDIPHTDPKIQVFSLDLTSNWPLMP